MENREYLNRLFDIYKDLLTKIEQETFISYYMEDLSLSEIGDYRGVTKSSVGKTLNRVINKLEDYESKLKLYKIKEELIKIDNKKIKDIISKYL